jgi:hypothetical protein
MKLNKKYKAEGNIFKVYLVGILFSFVSLLQAQTFPVQVLPQVTPPPPIYISSYADESTINSPLRVQIILNDLTIQSREVRLKAYFQGSGITFESNAIVTGASSLFLEGGIPLVLTNTELAPYFKFENITGISPNVYGSSIPEGTYQFCFEVYDVATGNRLSSKSCVTTVIFKNEPPFLVMPRNESNIAETNPQNIVFQWTPRSINVTNVEYELSLVEIWDTQIDPQAAFLSSPPIFQVTTTNTTYVYGPSDPLLLSGKNYAWRIQAKAKQGIEEIGLFKNEGYSEIFSFSYATACDLPISINHEVKGSTIANIFWDDFSTDVPEYTVRYRKKSDSNSENEWFLNKTTSNTTSLWDLKAGTIYEYQIQKQCTVTKSDWSTTKQFTTFLADDEESVYECGITPDFSLSNTEPLETLAKGDIFTAGDFPINVLEVSGSDGRFTGKGYVTIPYLNSIRVGVEFTNILINTDSQMAEGTVKTTYDPTLKNLLDVDAAIETVSNAVEAVGEMFEGDNDLDEIHVNWELNPETDIKIEDGSLIITNPINGAQETSLLGDDKVIVDGSGKTYHVDAAGNVTAGGQIDPNGSITSGNVSGVSNNGTIESLTAEGIKVTFLDTGIYGFDEKPNIENDKLDKEYTTIPDASGNDYTLIHQAVKKDTSITTTAKVELTANSEYTLSDLKFKTKTGEIIPIESQNESNNTINLKLTGRYTLESETIYSVVNSKQDTTKQLTAGAFKLDHFVDRSIDIVLVRIDSATMPDTQIIADIFKKGVATLNFETEIASTTGTNLLGDDGKLQIADNAWLNAYNDEQKAVISHIKSQIDGGFDDNKYYVLIFNNSFETSRSIAGFMPLQRQIGFIFNNSLSSGEEAKGSLENVVAHEVGHGVFALQHPFTEYGTDEKATNWLMDYTNGANSLNHMNWMQMHNPDLKFYIFQDEEDGEYEPWEYIASSNHILSVIPESLIDSVSTGFNVISKQGVIFTLPKITKDITFFNNGTLYGFTIDGIRYVSCTDSSSKSKFKGYSEECGKVDIYKNDLSSNLDFNTKIKTYYAIANNEDCGEISIFEGEYNGITVSQFNDGIDTSSFNLKTFEEVNSSVLKKETLQSNIFNCLKNKSLQTLYKYVEYSYPDFEHLESLFTTLNAFNCFKIDELIDETVDCTGTKVINETLNISEENHLINFNNQINDFIKINEDFVEYSLNLKILFEGYELFSAETYTDTQECLIQWVSNQDIRSEKALLPDCLYKNIDYPVALRYTNADIAFMSGIIDGGYIAGTDIANLIKAIDEFTIAYGAALIQCNLTDEQVAEEFALLFSEISKIPIHLGNQALINLTDIGPLVDSLIKENPAFYNAIASIPGHSMTQSMKYLVNFSNAVKEIAPEVYEKNEQFNIWFSKEFDEDLNEETDCDKYAKIREDYINNLKSLEQIINPTNDQFDPFIDQIKQELIDYGTLINDTNSIARYEHGKIAFEIIAEVLTAIATEGAGNVGMALTRVSTKALTSTKNIFSWLTRGALRHGIRASGDNITSAGRLLARYTDEALILLPESQLPSSVSNFKILDNGMPATDVKLSGGSILPEQKVTVVEYDNKKYLLLGELNVSDASALYKKVKIVTGSSKKYPDGFRDIAIADIKPMHDVPRASVPEGVSNAQKLIDEDGFKVLEPTLINPVRVVELPGGTKIIMDGHHRVKAMSNLLETNVAVLYTTYDDIVASLATGASSAQIENVYYILTIGKKTGKYTDDWLPTHSSLTAAKKQELINKADEFIRTDFPDLVTGLSKTDFETLYNRVREKLGKYIDADSWYDDLSEEALTKLDELGDKIDDLGVDLENSDELAIEIRDNPSSIDSWKVISHRSSGLRTNKDVLDAVSRIRSNPKYADIGLDDDLLGQLKGWGYGTDNGASFAEIITDLDRLLTNFGTNNITITNFNKITDVLKASNNANTKGTHWIIQDLANDVTTFNNKSITLEFTVPNARNTNSYLDVYCLDCFTGGKRLLVEYKHGPTSVTKDKIIEQFIERDLFNPNITSINQIQWRLKDTGLTKTQLNTWLNTDVCKSAIQKLGGAKVNQLLGRTDLTDDIPELISDAVIDYLNNTSNYNTIFN